jgi:signal transduction histidine kinase/PAS domain-containing protein
LLRDNAGNPVIECMCGNVICSRFNPELPFFTPRGSFWTNSTTQLLASTTDKDRQAHTRNRCHGEGYESVALVPLRSGQESLGLLQFNDRNQGKFTREKIGLFEQLGDNLASGIARRLAEEEVRRLASFPQINPSPVLEVDLSGAITFYNQAALEALEKLGPQAELRELIPKDLGKILATIRKKQERLFYREVEIKDTVFSQNIFYVEAFEVLRIYSMDITQRQQAEEELRRLNLRLALLAETAGQLLSSVSPQQVVNSLCLKVCTVLDCDAFFNFLVDEPSGRLRLNAVSGIPEEEARRIEWLDYGMAVCGCAARDGCRIVAEDIRNTPDPRTDLVKSYGIQAYACHPLMVEGRVLGTLSFGTRKRSSFTGDELALMKAVADHVAIAMNRQQAEENLKRTLADLERSNRELEEFAFISSHDMQEPLRQIANFSEILGKEYRERLDERAVRYFGFVTDGAKRMQTLINDLLSYSRVDQAEIPQVPTSLETVLQGTLHDLNSLIQGTAAEISHDPLPTLRVNPSQMGQLLQNLIGNAIKFRNEQPPRIHLSARQEDGEWLISVQDNGIGFNHQYAERIFKLFKRMHSEEKYPGTGIGLAICKKIVERHGGRIWAESKPGRGATFYFTIPV